MAGENCPNFAPIENQTTQKTPIKALALGSLMKKIFRFKRRNPPFLWRAKWFLVLFTIGCMEILPIPVTISILIFVLIARPLWFKRVVDKLYSHLADDALDESDLSYFSKYQLNHPKHFDKQKSDL